MSVRWLLKNKLLFTFFDFLSFADPPSTFVSQFFNDVWVLIAKLHFKNCLRKKEYKYISNSCWKF